MKRSTVGICAILAGCAIAKPDYTREGVSPERQNADVKECTRQAEGSSIRDCTELKVYMRCMTDRGYSRVPGTGSAWRCTVG